MCVMANFEALQRRFSRIVWCGRQMLCGQYVPHKMLARDFKRTKRSSTYNKTYADSLFPIKQHKESAPAARFKYSMYEHVCCVCAFVHFMT